MFLRTAKKVISKLNPIYLIKQFIGYMKDFPAHFQSFRRGMVELGSFLILFTVFLINVPIVSLLRANFIPNFLRIFLLKLNRQITLFVTKYDRPDMTRMNRLELFELAFRNMTFKKTRTIITIGGMALGVGAIVFLVSIGYGLQKLVIDRVARLDEMRQADVSVQPGSNVRLDDKAIADFKEIKQVEQVLPLIGVVAKVTYQGSNSDVAVYGVTTDYLKNSAIGTTNGRLFDSNEIGLLTDSIYANAAPVSPTGTQYRVEEDENGQVAGARVIREDVSLGDEIGDVKFSVFPRTWLRVRANPTLSGTVLGYTRRYEGIQYGKEYWGQGYDPEETGKLIQDKEGNWLGKWVRSQVYLWEEKDCNIEDPDCVDGKYMPIYDEFGEQISKDGYFAELEVVVDSTSFDPYKNTDVLGLSISEIDESDLEEVLADEDSAEVASEPVSTAPVSSEEEDLDYVDLLLESSESAKASDTLKVPLPPEAMREAVVNEAFLKVLGLDTSNPIGKEFSTSFIVTNNLLANSAQKVESEPSNYRIVGVIPGDNSPFFYVPLIDLKHLGVASYSQVKLVSNNQTGLSAIREKIGAMGYLTSSVVDTVSQINRLFGTVRVVLGLIGAVALGVASLGMFNTLTVSLLERTREVGLMKAMGMTSLEVKRLFLTESMLMGFVGGMLGILFGFISGKIISLILTLLGLAKGLGFIDVAYLPPSFVALVFGLSVFVGLVTGLYPSRRATKISALDALRYE